MLRKMNSWETGDVVDHGRLIEMLEDMKEEIGRTLDDDYRWNGDTEDSGYLRGKLAALSEILEQIEK